MTAHVLLGLLSYLLGSVPSAVLISRVKGVDIRRVGSGNVGATNVFRAVGKSWGIATFVGDALKGFVPAFVFPLWAARLLDTPARPELGILFGCAAIAGHNWPVFLRFKGGKGVATSAGVLLGAAPSAVAVGVAGWVLLLLLTGYVSVASIGAAVIVPAFGWWAYAKGGLLVPSVLTLLGALVVWRHRTNIARLRNGTEHRFRFGKKAKAAGPPVEGAEQHG